jgi:hypothetical protein
MTAYAVTIDGTDALIIDDPELVMNIADKWATFSDNTGIALAVPIQRIVSIQRLDGTDPDTGQVITP